MVFFFQLGGIKTADKKKTFVHVLVAVLEKKPETKDLIEQLFIQVNHLEAACKGEEKTNKTPAEQRDIFLPELFYNYINLRLMNSQCTMKKLRSTKESFDSSLPIFKGNTYCIISAIAGQFSFFLALCNLFFHKKFFIFFSKTDFLSFLVFEVFLKEVLKGDLFVTFDHVELMRFLFDC